jgi:DtxR family Mn-dependent transcriptional regulator
MAQEGLLHVEAGQLFLTGLGEPRARQAIRRHRLAERLLHDTFAIDNDVVDEHACRIEHSLSSQVTEKICIFLQHPRTCPHGSPIPPGVCCHEE